MKPTPTVRGKGEAPRYLPFALSVALLFTMLWDGLNTPFYGAAGLITLIPAIFTALMAWGLIVARAESTQACLLSVYLMALALLARDSLTGLETFPKILPHRVPIGQGAFGVSQLLWVLALGAVPWLYARQLAGHAEGSSTLLRTLTAVFEAFGFIAAQALLIFAATLYAPTIPLLASVWRSAASPHQILLLYASPLVGLSHFAAICFFLRLSRTEPQDKRHASASFWIFFAGSSYLLLSLTELLTNNHLVGVAALFLSYTVPVISLYAVEHYALFGIRLTLRRFVQYTLAKSTLILMMALPLLAAAFFIGNGFEWKQIGFGGTFLVTREVSPISAVISLLLATVSGTLLLLRASLLAWLDKTYFREVYDAQRVLNQMTRRLLQPSSPAEIGQIAVQGIHSALHPQSVLLLMQEENGDIVPLAAQNVRAPLELADASLLNSSSDLIYPPSELDAADTVQFQNSLSMNACTLLREEETCLILPIREDDVRAVLLLGTKDSGLDYTPEDREMLAALTPQIALGLQNTLLTRAALRRRTTEMNTRSAGFVELVERERRLFAADLHDQTLPELRGLLTDLQALQTAPAENAPQIPEMEERLKQAIENVRDMMESLRPSALEMLGLMPALENELRKATGRMRPPLIPQFHAADDAAVMSFPSFTEVLIFRVMQEAVNNACRHAKARHVRVTIDLDGDVWRLAVEDDGVGLPSAETRRVGNGLGNMQFRAGLIGANLLWSVPESGTGTRVELSLPLETQKKLE